MTSDTSIQNLFQISDKKNMSDRIFAKVSELIKDGTLPEGYIFPNETELTKQWSVGRSTIREAYKALEINGYVTRTKRGTRVNSQNEILGAVPLKKVMADSDAQSFYEFRMMLEKETAALSAERMTESELEELQDINEKIKRAKAEGNLQEMSILDKQFHEGIAKGAHNDLMSAAMAASAQTWDMSVEKNFLEAAENEPVILEKMLEEHQYIIEAIAQHDKEKARQLMTSHIKNVSM